MPRGKLENIGIPSLDEDAFVSDKKKAEDHAEKIVEIPIHKIVDFPNHPFQVRNDEEMKELIDSVGKSGVISPAIVRPKEDGSYEMIAGHRRKYACLQNGLKTIPCITRNLSDEEAVMIMVDTNLRQRQTILPSEKAFAYKMKLDAMKRQGFRSDLTSGPLGQKLSREVIAENSPDGARQIQRYIRLTNLVPELLELVDNAVLEEPDKQRMALRPAVELSYLRKEEQLDLFDLIGEMDVTPSHAQALKLRRLSEGKGPGQRLARDAIVSIMQEEKPNQVEQFKMPKERISKFFPAGTPAAKMEETIVKALELYRRRQRDRER